MDDYDVHFSTSDIDDHCTCGSDQQKLQLREPRFRAITPIREAVDRLNRVLEHHDDDNGPADLNAIDLYCELARARELLDAAQVDLTGEAVERHHRLNGLAELSGIPYGTVKRWAKQARDNG